MKISSGREGLFCQKLRVGFIRKRDKKQPKSRRKFIPNPRAVFTKNQAGSSGQADKKMLRNLPQKCSLPALKNQISRHPETAIRKRQKPPAQVLKNPQNGNSESGAKKMNMLPTAQNRVFWVCFVSDDNPHSESQFMTLKYCPMVSCAVHSGKVAKSAHSARCCMN